MKSIVTSTAGVLGGLLAGFFGGWTEALQVLLICMVIDFITGIVTAIMNKSLKTESGKLNSTVTWKGLAKKTMTLVLVGLAYQLEKVSGFAGIKDIVVIGFIVDESISILENASLMGIPIPNVLKKVLDVLHDRTEESSNSL